MPLVITEQSQDMLCSWYGVIPIEQEAGAGFKMAIGNSDAVRLITVQSAILYQRKFTGNKWLKISKRNCGNFGEGLPLGIDCSGLARYISICYHLKKKLWDYHWGSTAQDGLGTAEIFPLSLV